MFRVGKKPLFFGPGFFVGFWLFVWFFVVFCFKLFIGFEHRFFGFLYKSPKNHLCIFYFFTGSEAISTWTFLKKAMYAVEIRLFQDLRRSNALKAWLVLYRFGLQDPLLRTLLKTGCQPWEEDIVNANSILFAPRSGIDFWKYQEDFCHPPARQLTSYEAGYEMKSYFKYFVTCTLNGDSFEVFDTDGMGLGIRATQLVSFGAISLELCGFMEIIDYHLYS